MFIFNRYKWINNIFIIRYNWTNDMFIKNMFNLINDMFINMYNWSNVIWYYEQLFNVYYTPKNALMCNCCLSFLWHQQIKCILKLFVSFVSYSPLFIQKKSSSISIQCPRFYICTLVVALVNIEAPNMCNSANLNGNGLSGANLNGNCLSGAKLNRNCLSGAKLNGNCLSGAKHNGNCLGGANLNGNCLSGANLNETCLSGFIQEPLSPRCIKWMTILLNHASIQINSNEDLRPNQWPLFEFSIL